MHHTMPDGALFTPLVGELHAHIHTHLPGLLAGMPTPVDTKRVGALTFCADSRGEGDRRVRIYAAQDPTGSAHDALTRASTAAIAFPLLSDWWARAQGYVPYLRTPGLELTLFVSPHRSWCLGTVGFANSDIGFVLGRESPTKAPLGPLLAALSAFAPATGLPKGGALPAADAPQAAVLSFLQRHWWSMFLDSPLPGTDAQAHDVLARARHQATVAS